MPGNFYTLTLQDVVGWPVPNYQNPPERRTWLPGFAIAWQVLSTITVAGRIWLRMRGQSGAFGVDDVFLIAAWLFSIGLTATACVAVWDYDIGVHVWNVWPEYYTGALLTAWIAQIMFILSTAFCKAAVLLFYRRLVKDTYGRAWIYTVWILLFITIASGIAFLIVYCAICTPLHIYWDIHVIDQTSANNNCVNGDALTIATGAITIASDFWTAALPCAMFQFYDLGISRRQKIALDVIFCLGFLVTGVGIARTYFLWKIGRNQDLSWVGYDLFVASLLECQLALICTCAPSLRAFFRRYLPNRTRTYGNGTYGTRESNRTNTAPDRNSGQVNPRDSFVVPLKAVRHSANVSEKSVHDDHRRSPI